MAPPIYKPRAPNLLPVTSAPPVYRPQSNPLYRIVDRPIFASASVALVQRNRLPLQCKRNSVPGGAVYPTAAPTFKQMRIMQAKSAPVERRTAPSVYRPQQSGLAQAKPAPTAPPVYRPVHSVRPLGPAPAQAKFPQHPRPSFAAQTQKSKPDLLPGSRRFSIQPKFTVEESFSSNSRLMAAYQIFNEALDHLPESNVARLRTSATVDVKFTAAPMTESKAHASIDVPDPSQEEDSEFTKPLSMAAQYSKLVGRRGLDVTVAMNSSGDRAPYLVARTLAHELAGHVAPHLGAMERIVAGLGLSEEDQIKLSGVGPGGAMEHAKMVNGGNSEYDELVRLIAGQLSLSQALEMAKDYLVDISRYDPNNGRTFDLNRPKDKEEFEKQFNRAKTEIRWISELLERSNEQQRRLARQRAQKNQLTALILFCLVIVVLSWMYTS